MNIYIPYTYLIGWSEHNTFYYGRRTAKNCHPEDLWVKYFTSSKEVKKFRKINGDPDIIQIRKTFPNNPDACKLWECSVLQKMNAQHNPKFLNKRNGDHKWDRTGTVVVKDQEGNIFSVSIDDPRYISGEFVSIIKGKVFVKDKENKCFSVDKNDPRYVSGELVSFKIGNKSTTGYTNEYRKNNGYKTIPGRPKGSRDGLETRKKKSETRKGKLTVRDKEGNCFMVDKNDQRIKSKELIWISKSMNRKGPHSEETKQKMRGPKSDDHIENMKLAAAARPVFYCECCSIDIKGVSQWNRHLKSKKHHSMII